MDGTAYNREKAVDKLCTASSFGRFSRIAAMCFGLRRTGSIRPKAALRVFVNFGRNALKKEEVSAAVRVGRDGQNAAGLAVRDGQLQITELHFIREDAGFLDFLVQPQVVFAQCFFFGAAEADCGNAFARAFDGIVFQAFEQPGVFGPNFGRRFFIR